MRDTCSCPAVDVSSAKHIPSLGLSFPICTASALDPKTLLVSAVGMAKVSLGVRGQKGQSCNVANVATWW